MSLCHCVTPELTPGSSVTVSLCHCVTVSLRCSKVSGVNSVKGPGDLSLCRCVTRCHCVTRCSKVSGVNSVEGPGGFFSVTVSLRY